MADSALEAKTDRELLLLTAAELGHIREHLKNLDRKVGLQNSRLSALETWRTWLVGALAVIVPLSPLLIYEVRQSIFGGFGG